MLLSLRKNGLTSLFKEVRVFKEVFFPNGVFQIPDLSWPGTEELPASRAHTKGVMQPHAS